MTKHPNLDDRALLDLVEQHAGADCWFAVEAKYRRKLAREAASVPEETG